MPGRLTLQVVDALDPDRSAMMEVDEETTLADGRAIALSLPLTSCARALGSACKLHLCHDGVVLSASDENSITLSQLGVLAAPVVVVLAAARQATPSPASHPSPPPVRAAGADAAATEGPTPARTAPADEGPPADAVCRICFGVAYENGAGKLMSPCLCSGSMRFVHVTCLNEWRSQSTNPRSFYQCDQCHYQYNVQRTQWAALLESPRVHNTMSGLLLLAATAAAAAVCAPLGVAVRFYRLVAFNPYSTYQVGSLVASWWCWQLDVIVSGLLGVAIVGFALGVRDAYQVLLAIGTWALTRTRTQIRTRTRTRTPQAHRNMEHTWFWGVITAVATNDERIYRVFALLGCAFHGDDGVGPGGIEVRGDGWAFKHMRATRAAGACDLCWASGSYAWACTWACAWARAWALCVGL